MCAALTKQNDNGPRRIPRAVIAVCIVVSFANAAPILAQQGSDPSATNNAPVEAINAITQTAVSLGVLTCAARVQQVTSFIGVTEQTRASIRRPANPPDLNSFSVAMTLATDGTIGLAQAEFFPTQIGCKATYAITVNLAQPCTELLETGFQGMEQDAPLSENIQGLRGPNSLRVFLMDAGAGCTVVKTETIE